MEYRVNRRTGDRISVLGLGTSSLTGAGEAEGLETLRAAFEAGINYFDLAAAESAAFPLFGKACTPATPVGPCMVSTEGSCAAYFKYARNEDN